MIMHCSGLDSNLLMMVDAATGERLARRAPLTVLGEHGETINRALVTKPFDCGKVFDDARCEVIWPHQPL